MAASAPVVIASNQTAVPVSGTVGISGTISGSVTITGPLPTGTNSIGAVSIGPAISGGLTTQHRVSTAGTNILSIKASPGQLYGWFIYNNNASARKVVLHNTAGAPVAGAGVLFSIMIPPLSAANVFTSMGIEFTAGIATTYVTGVPDNDATGVGANDLIVNLFYK